jgi:hypothetical protein
MPPSPSILASLGKAALLSLSNRERILVPILFDAFAQYRAIFRTTSVHDLAQGACWIVTTGEIGIVRVATNHLKVLGFVVKHWNQITLGDNVEAKSIKILN